MKITREKLVACYQGLGELLDHEMDSDFASRFDIMQRRIEPDFQAFDKKRNELITKYGSAGPNGVSQVKMDSPKFKEFDDEMKKLLTEEIEIHAITMRRSDLLKSKVSFKGSSLAKISPLIKDDLNFADLGLEDEETEEEKHEPRKGRKEA